MCYNHYMHGKINGWRARDLSAFCKVTGSKLICRRPIALAASGHMPLQRTLERALSSGALSGHRVFLAEVTATSGTDRTSI